MESKHILYVHNFCFRKGAVYEIMRKNMAEPNRLHMTIRRMRTSCWIPTTTDTSVTFHTYCVSMATMVMRKRLHVTLYVHRHSCYSVEEMYNIKLVFPPSFSDGEEHRNSFPARRPGYEIDHSLPYSAIMNNEWMFTSMPLIRMISWRTQRQLYVLV